MSAMSGDPYDAGTPKYSSAVDIYDALQAMASGEEIGILGEMFADVSWDGQDYYYTDDAKKCRKIHENVIAWKSKEVHDEVNSDI